MNTSSAARLSAWDPWLCVPRLPWVCYYRNRFIFSNFTALSIQDQDNFLMLSESGDIEAKKLCKCVDMKRDFSPSFYPERWV